MKGETLKYRPEVDGLRAVAVVPVILFHAGLSQFQAGFFGVDIFFVISGYLITSVIVRGLGSERGFSLAHFYERRARRILPALALTVVLTLAIAPLALTPGQIKDVGQSVFATALFSSNYFFYLEIDYFNQFASKAPLLHTWSLAVEEQFYLAFPIVLMVLHRLGIRFRVFIAVILLASFLAAVWTTNQNPQLSFYSIHTRAWELAVGAAVALFLSHKGAPSTRHNGSLSAAAIIVLLFSLTILPADWSHPGFATLLPVLSTATLIVFLRKGDLIYRMLAHPATVHVGLMSYGLYLYHNPLFSYVDVYFDYLGEGTTPIKLALIPLVYVVSLVSLIFVERPALRTKRLGRKAVLTAAAIGILVFAGIGGLIHQQNGFQSQLTAFYESRGMRMLVDVPRERRRIEANKANYAPPDSPFDCAGSFCRKVLWIGDSLSEDSFMALASYGTDAQYRRVYFDDTCMAGVSSVPELLSVEKCRNRDVDFGNLLEEADEIVVAALWTETTYDDGYLFAAMLEDALNIPVTVAGAALFTDLSSFSIKAWRAGYETVEAMRGPLYDMQRWDRLRTTEKLKTMVDSNPELDWFDRRAFFCSRRARECSLLDEDGRPLIWDNAHMTLTAYPKFAAYAEERFRELRGRRHSR